MKSMIRTLCFLVVVVVSWTLTSAQTRPLTNLGKKFEVVDLGLSVNWATFNLGATKIEDRGSHYAWGETKPKKIYDWSTYKLGAGVDMFDEFQGLTKYVMDSVVAKYSTYEFSLDVASKYGYKGYYDNKTVLEAKDDAATVALGGKFRMPTCKEWQELKDSCKWEWVTIKSVGVSGYKVTSEKKGYEDKWIFLPAAGWHMGGKLIRENLIDRALGCYWSASLGGERIIDCSWIEKYHYEENRYLSSDEVDRKIMEELASKAKKEVKNVNEAQSFNFYYRGGTWNDGEERRYGLSVRPVADK
ncbi:MAG: hypothetical protein II951_13590 [Bacteroidales bacterium]|nr:hypothetical protein [Bacteroidales bacterium]